MAVNKVVADLGGVPAAGQWGASSCRARRNGIARRSGTPSKREHPRRTRSTALAIRFVSPRSPEPSFAPTQSDAWFMNRRAVVSEYSATKSSCSAAGAAGPFRGTSCRRRQLARSGAPPGHRQPARARLRRGIRVRKGDDGLRRPIKKGDRRTRPSISCSLSSLAHLGGSSAEDRRAHTPRRSAGVGQLSRHRVKGLKARFVS